MSTYTYEQIESCNDIIEMTNKHIIAKYGYSTYNYYIKVSDNQYVNYRCSSIISYISEY